MRDLLQWIDQADAFQASHSKNQWKAFVEACKSQFGFNPQKEGPLAGAGKLAVHEGPWRSVWDRFCEVPKRYPNIPAQIRKCRIPQRDIFNLNVVLDGWPQWNEQKERNFERELLTLGNTPVHEARKKLIELENTHHQRRNLIWAELDESPLARALEHLAKLAEITKSDLAAGSVEDLALGYINHGWQADDAAMRALAEVGNDTDLQAVSTAIRPVYLPWIEESARYLQKLVYDTSYPGGTCLSATPLPADPKECILFVDGLRFDTGKRLAGMLAGKGFTVIEELTWAALPSVTATGKAAVAPVKDKIRGSDNNADFEPEVAATGQSLKGAYHLKKLLTEAGWSVLERSDNGDGQGNAWCEFGDVDHEGHDRGWKLAKYLDSLLAAANCLISRTTWRPGSIYNSIPTPGMLC
ncbi:MAG: BREX-1 system phosphatase PglZ type B [Methylococcaceae bacterium]|nr:BREX-1 system phosphatase PglZ type B [Methylococcaceae bacterium]